MKRSIFLLLFFIAGCSVSRKYNYYFPPAVYQNDVQYMAKPYSKEIKKSSFYAQTTLTNFSNENGQGSSLSDVTNIYRSHTFKAFNLSYGVIGIVNNFYNSDQTATKQFSNKFSFGYGSNLSFSGYIPYEKVDWRFLGVDAVYTKEFGDYTRFRMAPNADPNYISFTQNELFTYGLFTEVIIKSSDAVTLAFKLGAYHTNGDDIKRINSNFIQSLGATTSVGIKHFVFNGTLKVRPTTLNIENTYGGNSTVSAIGVQLSGAYKF